MLILLQLRQVTRLSVCGMLEVSKNPSILFSTIREFAVISTGLSKVDTF
jgi:hypothetical protein